MDVLEFYGKERGQSNTLRLQAELVHEYARGKAWQAHGKSQADTVRHNCAIAPGANSWITESPSRPLMSDEVYSLATKMRMGLPPTNNMPKFCHCGHRMADDPWHLLKHATGTEAIQRHNSIRDIIVRHAENVGAICWDEPKFQVTGPDNRRTDIRIALGNRSLYVDVQVVHPLSHYYHQKAARCSENGRGH